MLRRMPAAGFHFVVNLVDEEQFLSGSFVGKHHEVVNTVVLLYQIADFPIQQHYLRLTQQLGDALSHYKFSGETVRTLPFLWLSFPLMYHN